MNQPLNIQQLDRMAWTIANTGFDGIPAAALRELGFEARRAGVNQAVAHTLVDGSASLVARQRAFGHVAAKIADTWHAATAGNTRAEPCAA